MFCIFKYLWKSGLLYIHSTWVRYLEKWSTFRGGMPEASQMRGTRARVGRFLNNINDNMNRRRLKGVALRHNGGTRARVGRFLNSLNGNMNRRRLKGVALRHILPSKPNEAIILPWNNIKPRLDSYSSRKWLVCWKAQNSDKTNRSDITWPITWSRVGRIWRQCNIMQHTPWGDFAKN